MKILKNPLLAVLLCVLLVLASTALSVDWKLGRGCEKITAGFYDGLRYKGSARPAVAAGIRELCLTADTMLIIGDNYGLDTAPLREDTEKLREAVSFQNPDIAGVYDAFESFYNKLRLLENELLHADLSQRHDEQMKELAADVSAARSAMDESGYNETVSAFLRKNDRFPARQFARLFGISFPVYFA